MLATLVSELDRIKLERKDPFAPLSEEYKDKLYEAYKMVRPYVEKDWDLLYDILVKGQFLITQGGVEIMRKQSLGGDVLNIVSKNATVEKGDPVGVKLAAFAKSIGK